MSWAWDLVSKRFRRRDTGRYLSPRTVERLRDRWITGQIGDADALAGRLARKELTLAAWETEMRALVKRAYVGEYALGRGGKGVMTRSDYGRLGGLLKQQYRHLRGFAEAAGQGELSEAQIRQRSRLYLNSARQAHERAKGAAWGVRLPRFPGDGSSECGVNDRCTWRLSETRKEVRARWVLRPGENCDDCVDRARKWNPLRFPKPKEA